MFNLFFIEVVPDLSTNVNERYLCNVSNISDPIEKLYKNKKIIRVSAVGINNTFSLERITGDDTLQQIKRLDIII